MKTFVNCLNKNKFVLDALRELSNKCVCTFPQLVYQYQKNIPTDLNKWSLNIVKDINISCSLGISGDLAPRWMRNYFLKNENKKITI